jgi:transglutaminase superfamily protein
VVFWIAMAILFVQREVLVPKAESTEAEAANEPTDTWMGIFLPGDVRIGFINMRTLPTARDGRAGTRYHLTAQVRMTLLSFETEFTASGSAWAPHEGAGTAFDLRLRSAGHDIRVEGTMGDGLLDATLHTGGDTFPLQFPVDEGLFLAGGKTVNVPDLEVGEEAFIDTFDPATLSAGRARVECVGAETIEVGGVPIDTKIITTTMNAVSSRAWIDSNQEVVKAETPFGMTLKRITPEEALEPLDSSDGSDLIDMLAVRPSGKRPFRGAGRMTFVLSGPSEESRPPSDDTQLRGDAGRYAIVVPSVAGEGLELRESPEHLASDLLVQAGHPRIREAALAIVGEEKDRWQAAQRIYEWVFDSIEKRAVFSVPSALEVLDSREGDCNEHTVLYAALARAVGIPTRIAIGVVWSGDMDGFYYHAWPEVLLDRWIWIDPTLGQPIADATHIKLLTGNIKKWFQLFPYLGQLEIEVLDVE